MEGLNEELVEELYTWVDQIPLSRPKKDIRRDFSDGVLVAEVVHHYCPRLVDVHNYAAANKTALKVTNWKLLNRKVFKKLGFEVTDDVINNVAICKPWAVEQFLVMLRGKIDRFLYENQRKKGFTSYGLDEIPPMSDKPEADQNVKSPMSQYSQTSPQNLPSSMKSPPHTGSLHALQQQAAQLQQETSSGKGRLQGGTKLLLEEKEQELLAKEETVQILQAKVRRMEHLLHLKDIRIDDLQTRLEKAEHQLRPTTKK